jgi:hypothetical protein
MQDEPPLCKPLGVGVNMNDRNFEPFANRLRIACSVRLRVCGKTKLIVSYNVNRYRYDNRVGWKDSGFLPLH